MGFYLDLFYFFHFGMKIRSLSLLRKLENYRGDLSQKDLSKNQF